MIKLLPEHLIDQIKAGEVIERPANLLKEIIENALDAQSTKIEVHIINNGLDLVSIKDNGCGIPFEELPLAFCRHATSKIDRFEDLYYLHTFGFRGEALASIAAISEVTCTSHHQATTTAGKIGLRGGKQELHMQVPFQETLAGTHLEIKNLFFNTPVRLNFIQSKNSEKNHLKKMIESFLLDKPSVNFTIKWDDDDKIIYPAGTEFDRIKSILKSEIVHTTVEYENSKCRMYFSSNPTGKKHYFFLNGRYIIDPKIHRIIMNSLEPIWGKGESGSYCYFLDVPTERVDVNIHPHKTVVKLADQGQMYSLIGSAPKNIESRPIPKLPQMKETIRTTHSTDFGHYFNNTSLHDQSSPLRLLAQTNNWSIIKENNQNWAIKHQSLINEHLKSSLKVNHFEMTPLFISEPIDGELTGKQLIELNQQYGLDLQIVEGKQIILRAIPSYLQVFPYQQIVQNIINSLNNKNVATLNGISSNLLLDERQIIYLIEKYPLVEKFPLTDQLFESIYGQ